MRKTIIILALLLTTASVFPQNPGFMGRHVFITGNVMLSPAWQQPNAMSRHLSNGSDLSNTLRQRSLGLNYFLLPDIEVIVWRKGSIGAGYNYFTSPFKGNIIGDSYNTDFTGQMTAHGFNVYYKQYLGQTHAPFGQYLKFNFDGFFYRYSDIMPANNTESLAAKNLSSESKNKLFGLKVEYGYDFLFFNTLKFSIGLSLGSTFGGYKTIKINNKNINSATVKDYADSRILGAYWFGLNCGIGVLTF